MLNRTPDRHSPAVQPMGMPHVKDSATAHISPSLEHPPQSSHVPKPDVATSASSRSKIVNDQQPPSPKPNYEELRRLAEIYSVPAKLKRRPVARLAMIATTVLMVVGAVTGLGAAWWLSSATTSSDWTFEKFRSAADSSSQLGSSREGTVLGAGGITPSELPYDGAASSSSAKPKKKQNESLPEETAVSGNSLSAKTASVQSEVSVPSEEIQSKTSTSAASSKENDEPIAQPKRNSEKKIVKAGQVKRRAAHKIAKDREIERIQEQAAEELKKKTESSRSIGKARVNNIRTFANSAGNYRAATKIARSSSGTRTVLAKCSRINNLIDREKCKWRLCGGRWGENGCPSYANHINS